MSRLTACIVSVAVTLPALAANRPVPYRTAPPAGIVITAEDRERLQLGTARLEVEIESLRARSGSDARVRKLLPDVEIFHKAVDWALRYDEFFRSNLSRELTLLSGPGRILSFSREKEHWQARSAHQPLTTTAGVKSPKLQGPIDDAFMENFLVVRPSKPSSNGNVGKWIDSELARFTNEWRAQFRGDVRVIDARMDAVKRAAEAGTHLVVWGDLSSNPIIAKLLPELPLQWDARELRVGTNHFDAMTRVPVLIFPNPLNRSRYIVLNSGPTFFDFGAASNAQQTPKLPDYAVLDITVPHPEKLTRGVALAGFFDETWKLPDASAPAPASR